MSSAVDVHGDRPAPGTADHDIGLVPGRTRPGRCGRRHRSRRRAGPGSGLRGHASLKYVGFTPPGTEFQPWRKRICMGVVLALAFAQAALPR